MRSYGLSANAHRGKVKKASLMPVSLGMMEEKFRHIPSKGWGALIRRLHRGRRSAEMIRKVFDSRPHGLPSVRRDDARHRFLTDFAVVDRIIDHLKLTFVADKAPPPHIACQEVLMTAETAAEYIS